MKAHVYSKAAYNFHTKEGAYAYMLVCGSELEQRVKRFKGKQRTLTSADCAAAVNAMFFLSKQPYLAQLVEVHMVTDSSKVVALFETLAWDNGCEEVMRIWRDEIRPLFAHVRVSVVKLAKGDMSSQNAKRIEILRANAGKEMDLMNELIK